MAGPIEQLKNSRWWKAAIRKYASHLIATKNQQCPDLREDFCRFASEVLSTPEPLRDDLLKIDAPSTEPARLRYRQYDSPTAAEQKIGTAPNKKKRKKVKNVDIRAGR